MACKARTLFWRAAASRLAAKPDAVAGADAVAAWVADAVASGAVLKKTKGGTSRCSRQEKQKSLL